MTRLVLFSPSGVTVQAAPVRLALRRLRALGFDARLDPDALKRFQRFGGTDEVRLGALHRIAAQAPSISRTSRRCTPLAEGSTTQMRSWPASSRALTSQCVAPGAPRTRALRPVICNGPLGLCKRVCTRLTSVRPAGSKAATARRTWPSVKPCSQSLAAGSFSASSKWAPRTAELL